jgi:hypothetical protein
MCGPKMADRNDLLREDSGGKKKIKGVLVVLRED